MPKNFKVFFDIVIGTKAVGRVIFELFMDITPKTATNFKELCTGEYGISAITKKKLCYAGSQFHKITNGMIIQGGDIINHDGSGGESIYGKYFNDENFDRKHSCAGLLSMANQGRNTNSSQFYITLKACPHLDGKNVVFGQIMEGMEVAKMIGKVPTDEQDKPMLPVIILSCGELNDAKLHVKYDMFLDTLMDHQKEMEKRSQEQSILTKLQNMPAVPLSQLLSQDEKRELEEAERKKEEEEATNVTLQVDTKDLNEQTKQKLFDLQLKLNQAQKLNNKAVKDEKERMYDKHYEKGIRKKEWESDLSFEKNSLKRKGISDDKLYLMDPSVKYEGVLKRQRNGSKSEVCGWDVFNQDSLYKAHFKRTKNLAADKEIYKQEKNGEKDALTPDEAKLNLLPKILEEQYNHNIGRKGERSFQGPE